MVDRPYPAYSGDDAVCPKCGGSMDKRYQPGGTWFVDPGLVQGFGSVEDHPEWLMRECFGCGYGWPEMCADAEGRR